MYPESNYMRESLIRCQIPDLINPIKVKNLTIEAIRREAVISPSEATRSTSLWDDDMVRPTWRRVEASRIEMTCPSNKRDFPAGGGEKIATENFAICWNIRVSHSTKCKNLLGADNQQERLVKTRILREYTQGTSEKSEDVLRSAWRHAEASRNDLLHYTVMSNNEIWGFDSGTSIFTNGVPTQEAILKLARPIMVN